MLCPNSQLSPSSQKASTLQFKQGDMKCQSQSTFVTSCFFLGIKGMETSVALAQEGNPFTGESFMCKEAEATFEGVPVKWENGGQKSNGGGRRIRTSEGPSPTRFTAWPLWPLGHPSIFVASQIIAQICVDRHNLHREIEKAKLLPRCLTTIFRRTN
jgi:hypothetical protein